MKLCNPSHDNADNFFFVLNIHFYRRTFRVGDNFWYKENKLKINLNLNYTIFSMFFSLSYFY